MKGIYWVCKKRPIGQSQILVTSLYVNCNKYNISFLQHGLFDFINWACNSKSVTLIHVDTNELLAADGQFCGLCCRNLHHHQAGILPTQTNPCRANGMHGDVGGRGTVSHQFLADKITLIIILEEGILCPLYRLQRAHQDFWNSGAHAAGYYSEAQWGGNIFKSHLYFSAIVNSLVFFIMHNFQFSSSM